MKNTFIIFMLALGVLFFLLFVSNNLLTVTKYPLSYDGLPTDFDGFTIIHLSDLHSASFGKKNKTLIKKIHNLTPDIIVMTGDMVNSIDVDFNVFISLAKELAKEYQVYYVVGNHEQNLEKFNWQKLFASLQATGVTILDNNKVTIARGKASIDIYGLWFNLRYYSSQKNDYVKENPATYYFSLDKMEQVIKPKATGKFNILLAHNPVYFDTYVDWGADLILSGHFHGGMWAASLSGRGFFAGKNFFPLL